MFRAVGVLLRYHFEFLAACGAAEIVGLAFEIGAMLRDRRIDYHAADRVLRALATDPFVAVIFVVIAVMLAIVGRIHADLLPIHVCYRTGEVERTEGASAAVTTVLLG